MAREQDHDLLGETLQTFLRESVFSDDATIAVLISTVALEYYASRGKGSKSGRTDNG